MAGFDTCTIFQFQYGTIESINSFSLALNSIDFNSSMVRLKAHHQQLTCVAYLFQFQYGTIERLMLIYGVGYVNTFQFQYGTIESNYRET